MTSELFSTGSSIKFLRQAEVAECGLACIGMIANYYNYDIDLGTMRRRFEPSLRGTTLRGLIDICSHIGFVPRAVRASLDKLAALHVPAILHWDMNHYVVLETVSGSKALIHNPAIGTRWISLEEVSNHFTGVALELRPGDAFTPKRERKKLHLSQLWNHISGLKRGLAQALTLTAILQILVLASPYYLQLAVDRAIPSLDVDFLTVLAWAFILVAIFNAAVSLLRGLVLLHAGTSVAVGLASNVFRRLMRLPVPWFEKRHSGDVLARLQSIVPIQKFLTESAVASIVDGVFTVLTLTIMFFYSPALTALALIALALQTLVHIVTFSAQRQAEEARIVASSAQHTTQIETLRGIRSIRLSGRESLRLALWQTRLVAVANQDVRGARILLAQQTANLVITGIEQVLSIWLAVRFVINGEGFSLGMLFAFLAYKVLFGRATQGLLEQLVTFRMLDLHLARLSDIALTEEDQSLTESGFGPKRVLQGDIKVQNVSFQYSSTDPFVLSNVNLEVAKGQHVAITGPSGGGKSTLAKVLLGLAQPTSGSICVDDLPIPEFGWRAYHQQVGAVLQDDCLFAGSLAENISFFEEQTDMEKVQRAARAAAIHEDILLMPMQYDTLVGEMGSTLSGGQKQRVLLARALYREPKLLIIDEGTAHLDVAYERLVNQAISELGITRIVIAHRKETIEAASVVFEMVGGRLSPRDTGPTDKQQLFASDDKQG